MAIELTTAAKFKSQEPSISPQLILEIDGIDHVFGAYDVRKKAVIGDDGLRIGEDWTIDGAYIDPASLPYISMTGSSKQLTQQLNQEKGGSGSIGSISIELIDKDGAMTKIVSSQIETDLLYREATVYLGFKGLAHPTDSVCILRGVITSIQAKIGSYVLVVQHPEIYKKTSLFSTIDAVLVSAITSTSTILVIDNITNLITHCGSTYLKIDDEWIQYRYMIEVDSGFQIYGLTRGARGTTAAAHDADATVSSGILISGNLIELALRLMLSGAEPIEAQKVISINQVSPTKIVQNALLFADDVKTKLGLVVGDIVSVSGINYSGSIVSFGKSELGYYVVTNGELLGVDSAANYEASFESKYNVWTHGCGIAPKYVDIEEHERLQSLYGNSFLSYEFFFDDSVEAQELINEQIYFPSGLYQLPRKGVISVGITRAPIADNDCVAINSSNIINPEKLIIQRGASDYFYNIVKYYYDYDAEDDEYFSKLFEISADSWSKIKSKDKELLIECRGVKTYSKVRTIIRDNAARFLKRYQFACEFIEGIEVNFKTGFKIDIGDTVLFGDAALKMADLKNATRSFEPRLMEVVNKTLDLKTGRVKLDLLDTSYEENARYGVVSPSSLVVSSTSNSLTLNKILSIETKTEQEKWSVYTGQHVQIHSPDWTRKETVEILGFESSNIMIVSPMTITPQKGDIVTIAPYSPIVKVDRIFKGIFCYINPTVEVSSGSSTTAFTVEDSKYFTVGNNVIVHSKDWSVKSNTVEVTGINGTLITTKDLGITPLEGYQVDLIGYPDGGAPYLASE